MYRRLLTRGEEGYDVDSTSRCREDGDRIRICGDLVFCLGVKAPDYAELIVLHGEMLHGHRNTSVGKAVSAHEDIFTGVDRSALLEDVLPADSTAHVHLAFVEAEDLGAAIHDLADREMAVITWIGKGNRGIVVKTYQTCRRHGVACRLEVHIPPSVGSVLNLTGHRILPCIDTEGPSQ